MSVVTRVTSEPVGRLSNQARSSSWMWRKTLVRRSAMTVWPVRARCATSK